LNLEIVNKWLLRKENIFSRGRTEGGLAERPCHSGFREGVPLLIVETEANGNIWSWLIIWARRAGTRDLYPALAAQASPVQNTLFRTVHYISRAGPPVSECVSPV